eukprot:EG_transcript_29831
MNNHLFARPARLEAILPLPSDGSDCGSSEGLSSEYTDGTPTHALSWPEGARRSPDTPGSRRDSRLPIAVLGDASAAPPATAPAEEKRQLCLDFLNGKCGRHRSRCRYYHPAPGEVSALPTVCPQGKKSVPTIAGTIHDPARPVCEVWALTGFCKFGARCWKQHPQLEAQAPSPLAEPLTQKFKEWLLRQPGTPSPNPAEPLSPGAVDPK